jgi:isocitrate dehydrogenase kinase/phosphatase
MVAATENKPLSDLMFDWLTVLQNKAEGIDAYERYIRDAESANATKCISMLRRLRDQDAEILREVKEHVFGMIAECQSKESND